MGSGLDFPADWLGDPDPQSAHLLGGRGSLKLCGPETMLTRAGTSLCLSVSLPIPHAPPTPGPLSSMGVFAQHLLGAALRTEPPLAAPWSGAFCGVLMSPGHVAVLLNTQASGSCSSLGSPERARSREGRGEAPSSVVVSFRLAVRPAVGISCPLWNSAHKPAWVQGSSWFPLHLPAPNHCHALLVVPLP